MTKIYIPILLLFLTAQVAAQEPKTVSTRTIAAIQKSIVPIVCTQVNDKTWELKKIIGSGFLVNKEGYFLTAAHVVLNWEQSTVDVGPCFAAIFIPDITWGERDRAAGTFGVQWLKFTDCVYNANLDVAACKLIQNPFTNPTIAKQVAAARLGTIAQHSDGSPIAFTGFPLNFHVPVTSKGYIAAYTAADRRLAIDKSAWPGASGSPVYDAEGRVIGMVTETGLALGAGLTYARPVEVLIDFLREQKIAFEK